MNGDVGTATAHARSGDAWLDHEHLLGRAHRTLSAQPRPFLRWAGSKQRLLSGLVPLLPNRIHHYYEPFFGSGSLYFLIEPAAATIGDTNVELIQTYAAVRDDYRRVLKYLDRLDTSDKNQYYDVRSNRANGRFKRAAEFIFLNQACWNGLYRENSRGEFNVPYGAPDLHQTFDALNLKACASLLQRSALQLHTTDFEVQVLGCSEGDFVFLDPPYVTGHNNNGFIDYNRRLFSWNDQLRLAELAKLLRDRGANVLVTNAFHDPVLELYEGFNVTPVERSSTLAGDVTRRRRVTEVVIRSYA